MEYLTHCENAIELLKQFDSDPSINKCIDELEQLIVDFGNLPLHLYLTNKLDLYISKFKKDQYEILNYFFINKFMKTPRDTVKNWFIRINSKGFQGGYGHSFTFQDSPHHWVISEKDYPICKPDLIEELACVIEKFKYTLNKKAEYEHWGN